VQTRGLRHPFFLGEGTTPAYAGFNGAAATQRQLVPSA